MEFTFKDKKLTDGHLITRPYNIEEYIYPDIKTGFELLGMHVRSTKCTWNYPEHEHQIYELNLVTEGHQIFNVNGTFYDQYAGDIIFIKPGELHSSVAGSDKGFTYFCMHFNIDDKLFLPYFKDVEQLFFHSESKLNRQITPLLERLIHLLKNSESCFVERMHVHAVIFELLAGIVSGLKEETSDSELITNRTYELAYRIADKLEDMVTNEDEELHKKGIEDLASELNISLSYCHKLFKKVYNMSPRKYLSYKKTNKSKTLLMEKQYSVEEVAELMGYYDLAHFSRQFKRWTGFTPSQYRKNYATRSE
ncbi:helix-turn-helix domain-containing protein [Alteribacter populi]|uniref:helix-turn-helix domain-containing protein n=1 Tax=Alteribacter populi TaxID=2011011 RepID=UPI000BBAE261|nr:AraC family transcriptional regulator [Alteribacter populi]